MNGTELVLILQTINLLAGLFAANVDKAPDITPEQKAQMIEALNKAKELLPEWK